MVDTSVRWATADDLAFASQDGYIAEAAVKRKIVDGEVVVAVRGGERLGYVRLDYLWGKIPYIALIRVVTAYQRNGIGRAMLTFLARELRARGHSVLLSSSQADEPSAQAWHRRQGFVECGMISGLNSGGVGEVFFRLSL